MIHHHLAGAACCIIWHVRSGSSLYHHWSLVLSVLYREKGEEASIDLRGVWALSSFNPLLTLPKTLVVKAVLCKIFLVRCGGSASSSVLCDRSHGGALSMIRLAGTGMSHQTHMLPWGKTYSPLHRSQIFLLCIHGVSQNLYFCTLYFCHVVACQGDFGLTSNFSKG